MDTTVEKTLDRTGQTVSAAQLDVIYMKVIKRLVPILIVSYIIAYLDRVNIGFAKLTMLDDLSLSDAAYAFGASVFFWGYVLFEVPSNVIMHKIGARIWIARIMFTWGVIAVATMFTAELAALFSIQNSTMFYILRFLLGTCEAGFFPGVVLYINYWFPSNRQSKIFAAFILALPLSLVLGGPLSGWLMEATHGFFELAGWQWMLGIEGLPAVIMAIVIFFALPNGISDAKWLSQQERILLENNLNNENKKKTYHFLAALKEYRVWLLGAIMFTFNTGFYGLSFWLPSIMKASGVQSSTMIGLLSAIPFVAAAVFMMFNARHSESTGERRWHAAVPAFCGGGGLILSAMFANNVPVAVFFLCVAASGILGMMPIFWTYPGRYLSGNAAAAGIAFISSIGAMAGIAGAYITNITKNITGDINDGTYVLACAVILSGILVLILPRDKTSAA